MMTEKSFLSHLTERLQHFLSDVEWTTPEFVNCTSRFL